MRIRLPVAVALVSILFAASHADCAETPGLPWHLPQWRYRQIASLLFSNSDGRINTALIRLADSPPRIADDGRDIRVLDERGRAVAFQLINGVRDRIAGPAEPGLYLIQFQIDDPAVRRYLVYYGNPDAAAQHSEWEKKLGGLSLTTYANATQRAAGSLRDMLGMLGPAVKLGEGLRREINDPENPYGPSEFFLSKYEGQLYCPKDGQYQFATDSDDASFLMIDDTMVVQWPNGHSPAGAFAREHIGVIDLKAGIHRILYYHAQAGGGSLARAGWCPPGDAALVTIPEMAFVRELLTESLEKEDRQNPVSAFFRATTDRTVQLGNDGPVFSTVSFRDLSRSYFGEIAVREWDFGDGTVSREADPVHTFPGGRVYHVTLRGTDRLGFEGTSSCEIRAGNATQRLDVDMELALAQGVVYAQEAPAVSVNCRISGAAALPVEFVTEFKRADGNALLKQRESATLAGGAWRSFEMSLSPEIAAALDTGEIEFRLEHVGVPVACRKVRIISAAAAESMLPGGDDKLVDAQGRALILRLAPDRPGRSEWSLESVLKDKRAVRLAVIDGSISGHANEYPGAVADEMDRRFQKDRVEVRLFSSDVAGGCDLQNSLVDLPGHVKEFAPDIIVVAASLCDVLKFVSVDRFERNLQALVERLRSAIDAEVVLLSPPPTMGNPGLSRAYAIAAKRVGMREKLPVADAYSAFVRAGEDGHAVGQAGWEEFYRDENGASLYHKTPTRRGQELLAQTLARTLCQKSVVGYERRD